MNTQRKLKMHNVLLSVKIDVHTNMIFILFVACYVQLFFSHGLNLDPDRSVSLTLVLYRVFALGAEESQRTPMASSSAMTQLESV